MSTVRAALWNPIVAKELRSRMRSWRVAAVLAGYLTIVGAVGYAAYTNTVDNATDVQQLGSAGRTVFDALAAAVMVFVAVLVPGLVGGAVSGERERQTLDLLLCTPVRPARIILGKLVSSLAFVVLLLVASVPLFSAVFMLGGVSLSEVLVVTLIGFVTAVTLGGLAMLCSVALRRTTSSTVSSYVLTLLIMVIPLLVGLLLAGPNSAVGFTATPGGISPTPFVTAPSFSGPVSGALIARGGVGTSQAGGAAGAHRPAVELFSPATALAVTLAARSQPGACANFGPVPFGQPCAPPSSVVAGDVLASGLFGGWREWQVFVLLDALVAALAVVASVVLLRGGGPLRVRRRGREEPGP